MSAANPFNPRLVFGLIAAGIAAFAALLLLLAYGGGIAPSRGGGRADAMSVAATGFRGLSNLIENFREVHLDETEAEWADHLLIVTIDPRTNPGQVRRLLERRADMPTVLILPKWVTRPNPRRPGWVTVLGPGLGAVGEQLIGNGARVALFSGRAPARVAGQDLLDGLSIPVPPHPQQISGDRLTPLAELPGGGALVARLGDHPHYVVADPDLLNNHGIADSARARAALAMIERMNEGRDSVDFDLTLSGPASNTGANAPSMLRLAFEPPFLAMTLALVIAALLAGYYGAFRFGPVRREERAIAFGKAPLVENSAGLIRLAGREARLGGAYAEVVRQDVARRTSAPAWLQGEKLDAYLDRISKGGAPKFTALADELERAGDRHDLLAAARSLDQWKKDSIP